MYNGKVSRIAAGGLTFAGLCRKRQERPMKHKNLTRAAGLLAACLALGLAGCGATASSTATATITLW